MKHYKRVKATYDRGYVNAMDKIRVFIESKHRCTRGTNKIK